MRFGNLLHDNMYPVFLLAIKISGYHLTPAGDLKGRFQIRRTTLKLISLKIGQHCEDCEATSNICWHTANRSTFCVSKLRPCYIACRNRVRNLSSFCFCTKIGLKQFPKFAALPAAQLPSRPRSLPHDTRLVSVWDVDYAKNNGMDTTSGSP